jgi:hypothetical protein
MTQPSSPAPKNDFRLAPGSVPPADLCAAHRESWSKWRTYALSYDPRYPKDFGNIGPIMDARTSHADRRAEWVRKGRLQLDQVEALCRRGGSPQCSRPDESQR